MVSNKGMKRSTVGLLLLLAGMCPIIVFNILAQIPISVLASSNMTSNFSTTPQNIIRLGSINETATIVTPEENVTKNPMNSTTPPSAIQHRAQPELKSEILTESQQVKQQYNPPVRVISQYAYVTPMTQYGGGGNLHIVGEVINESDNLVGGVTIVATLYDANNQVVGTGSGHAQIDPLYPQQKSPFEIVVYKGNSPVNLMSAYSLAVDWR